MNRNELLIMIELQRLIMNILAALGKSTSELLPVSQALDCLITEYYRGAY